MPFKLQLDDQEQEEVLDEIVDFIESNEIKAPELSGLIQKYENIKDLNDRIMAYTISLFNIYWSNKEKRENEEKALLLRNYDLLFFDTLIPAFKCATMDDLAQKLEVQPALTASVSPSPTETTQKSSSNSFLPQHTNQLTKALPYQYGPRIREIAENKWSIEPPEGQIIDYCKCSNISNPDDFCEIKNGTDETGNSAKTTFTAGVSKGSIDILIETASEFTKTHKNINSGREVKFKLNALSKEDAARIVSKVDGIVEIRYPDKNGDSVVLNTPQKIQDFKRGTTAKPSRAQRGM